MYENTQVWQFVISTLCTALEGIVKKCYIFIRRRNQIYWIPSRKRMCVMILLCLVLCNLWNELIFSPPRQIGLPWKQNLKDFYSEGIIGSVSGVASACSSVGSCVMLHQCANKQNGCFVGQNRFSFSVISPLTKIYQTRSCTWIGLFISFPSFDYVIFT